jgi:hypothetical protein
MQASETYLWHIWPARHWPASHIEEETFIADLTSAASMPEDKIYKSERGDLTTVLNALRNGMSYEELLRVAPGVAPKRLLSAYRDIDRRRSVSMEAFASLVDQPTMESVEKFATLANRLLPVPTFVIKSAIMNSPNEIHRTISLVRDQIKASMDLAASYEEDLQSTALSDLDRVRLGRSLYDPFSGGVWSYPYYISPRVGTLVPARVRDLLEEREV